MTLLREYAAELEQLGQESVYDEFVGPDGTLRQQWKPLAELATALTASDIGRVDAEIGRFLADDGVTYSRPGERPSSWTLDPFPLIIDAASWAPLERGLAQRAELLNAMLVDLYGNRRLLREGVLPAAAVLGHSGYLRQVARTSARDPRPLVFAATDLGRDQEGEWRVLSDRTQAPSGIGYAMENRKVLSRVLPELYREADGHRIEPFVAALRSALLQSAEGDRSDPRVVVLTPGPQSETAYDQANLAAALGFPLVRGSDLVVRDGWVHLRARDRAGRLERVDVILRRVDASFSDPLELRGDSRLGVAGLTQAVRRGRVRVVNGLGSGVLENPALQPFLAAACRTLLGEDLRLESVPTWWCGEPEGLERVLDATAELTVRAIDGASNDLVDVDVAEVRRRVLADPTRYVGQERLLLSQAPTWQRAGRNSRLRPRPVTLRAFTLRYGSVYRPLLGGLGTVWDDPLRASQSKDVWVLKADPADADQGLAEVLALTNTRSAIVTLPGVLDDMYWYGRYAERAEDMLRLILSAHVLAEDVGTRPNPHAVTSLDVMMAAIGRLAGPSARTPDAEFRSLLLDNDRIGSAAHAIWALRGALSGIRDQLSLDTWRAFGVVERAVEVLVAEPRVWQSADSAGRMLTGLLSLQGVEASMVRDSGWRMIAIGRAVERATQLVHLLASTTTVRRGIDVDRTVLNSVLAAAESAVTHRRRYRGYVRIGSVLELLVTDLENPRSLAFCAAQIGSLLEQMPGSTGSTRPERITEDLVELFDQVDVAGLVAIGGEGRPNLAAFLVDVTDRLRRLSQAITELHFEMGPAPQLQSSLFLGASPIGAGRR